jgi:hypothetical protein
VPNADPKEEDTVTIKIDQHEVAGLSDDQLRSLVAALEEGAAKGPGGLPKFYGALAGALCRLVADRLRALAVLELDAVNDEYATEGELVGPEDDPVADALAALRSGLPGGPAE